MMVAAKSSKVYNSKKAINMGDKNPLNGSRIFVPDGNGCYDVLLIQEFATEPNDPDLYICAWLFYDPDDFDGWMHKYLDSVMEYADIKDLDDINVIELGDAAIDYFGMDEFQPRYVGSFDRGFWYPLATKEEVKKELEGLDY